MRATAVLTFALLSGAAVAGPASAPTWTRDRSVARGNVELSTPEDMAAFERARKGRLGIRSLLAEIGQMVVEGAQIVVGDVNQASGEVGYEVLCRRHYRRRMTAASARAGALSPDVLPVDTLERS